MTQKKIAEITVQDQSLAHLNEQLAKRHGPDPEWLRNNLTPAQNSFVENRSVEFRRHPRNSKKNTLELFVDALTLTAQDSTVIELIFPR